MGKGHASSTLRLVPHLRLLVPHFPNSSGTSIFQVAAFFPILFNLSLLMDFLPSLRKVEKFHELLIPSCPFTVVTLNVFISLPPLSEYTHSHQWCPGCRSGARYSMLNTAEARTDHSHILSSKVRHAILLSGFSSFAVQYWRSSGLHPWPSSLLMPHVQCHLHQPF